MPKKRKPLTVEKIAETLGVTTDTIYRTLRVARQQENSPLRPLFLLARKEGVTRSVASRVISTLKLEGVPAIKKLSGPDTERFVGLLLATKKKDVQDAIAKSEKIRKESSSGARARMSKTQV